MKKLFVALLVVGFLPYAATAETRKKGALDSAMENTPNASAPDTDSCGLGWQITQKKSLMATSTRGTTNNFVPPVFGMTSGTLGCAQHSFAKNDMPAATYVFSNYEPLSMEMAQGSGEFLAGFARTLGCGDAVQAEFGSMTQQNYKALIGTSAVEMFHNVKAQVKKNPVLATGCRA